MIPKYKLGDYVIALSEAEDRDYYLLFSGTITKITITKYDISYAINNLWEFVDESKVFLIDEMEKLRAYIVLNDEKFEDDD